MEGFNLPREEEKILEFWEKNEIFEKTLAKRKEVAAKKKFVFYEGPPYANGKPGIHHVLARIYKDIILRYRAMRGYFVPRRAGWDTHGLPVEIAAEKSLGLKSKKEIEKFGIKLFNQKAKEAVWIYKDEWEKMTKRIGYWLDLKNAYVTYEPEYIETIWWILSQISQRGLLYKDFKIVPWCPRCGTALSSHELAQGYKETEDQSVYVKFKLKKGQKIGNIKTDDKTYILSWTTTPWTLPGNVALAIGKKINYVEEEENGEKLILSAEAAQKLDFKNVKNKFMGAQLVGLEYEPLFETKNLQSENSYKVYSADFVETGEGTGVVHTAVMYGEDDYRLGKEIGLPQYHTVDEEGKFLKDVSGLAGMPVKAKETEEKIFDALRKENSLFKIEIYRHEYPFCWRCGSAVIYYARVSWFIAMQKLRDELLKRNKKINWIPGSIKEGRFGEWLREVKDWNLSRERYWGAPLPVWECGKCGKREVIGSLNELNKKSGGSKNNYWTMRHGQAQSNVDHIIDSGQKKIKLTAVGRAQALKNAEKLKKELSQQGKKIDLIISSPILRTKETAEISKKVFGIKKIIFDERLEEIRLGPTLTGCHDTKYHKIYPTYESRFEIRPEGGESLRDLRQRVFEFMEDLEKKYKNKNILLVTHEYPIWMIYHTAEGWSEKQAIVEKRRRDPEEFVDTGSLNKLNFKIIPRDDAGLVDLHRPFADGIKIKCVKCGAAAARAKEVIDVWFDSGAMPLAQANFPFAFAQNQSASRRTKTKNQNLGKLDYPADYICEGMDQTRGWFYTLLAIATTLDYEAPYKNVIALGLINDKFGQKMSKSKGNVVDPWEVLGKYGADAVRWYFYTSSPPGESKNFDEQEVLKSFRKFHSLVYNSLVFYKTYAGNSTSVKRQAPSKNVLDEWILARLGETISLATNFLEKYRVREAAFCLENFADDLSRWYIRRSRRRFQKPENKKDYESARATLGYVLAELAKLTAPFCPFFSEIIYRELGGKMESVHLEDWPRSVKFPRVNSKSLMKGMAEARRLASLALAIRAEAGIKVRQPLAQLKIKSKKLKTGDKKLFSVLADEVNVKKIVLDKKISGEIELDAKITPELRREGILRELARAVQELRQEAGLKPQDKITLFLEMPEEIKKEFLPNGKIFKNEVGAREILYKKQEKILAEKETELERQKIIIGLKK